MGAGACACCVLMRCVAFQLAPSSSCLSNDSQSACNVLSTWPSACLASRRLDYGGLWQVSHISQRAASTTAPEYLAAAVSSMYATCINNVPSQCMGYVNPQGLLRGWRGGCSAPAAQPSWESGRAVGASRARAACWCVLACTPFLTVLLFAN